MIRIVEYFLEGSDREPLEKTLRENDYTFQFPSGGSYRRQKILHESRGEEGWFESHAGTPVVGGGTSLTIKEGTKLEAILFDLNKKLKN
jgi:hypothetical protein